MRVLRFGDQTFVGAAMPNFRPLSTRSLSAGPRHSGRKAGERRRDRAQRRANFTRLRNVGRVHAPEADMRPVLPCRSLLLAAVAPRVAGCTHTLRRARPPPPAARGFLASLVDRARDAAADADEEGVSNALVDAADAPVGVDAAVCVRAVAVSAVQTVAQDDDTSAFERIMSRLAHDGVLQSLPKADIGMLLDIMVRGKLRRGDLAGAFRSEYLSRLLEVRLRRGTYTDLMQNGRGLPLSLAIFHRALAVGVEPNTKMFNVLLDACFRAADGTRARAVLTEMADRDVRVNGETVSILLHHTQTLENVDTVLQLLQSPQASVAVTPGLADGFISAYIRTSETDSSSGGESSSDAGELCTTHSHIGRCFAAIDWFYEKRIGVSAKALNTLLTHCAETGQVEAGLRAWREMRRGWLGAPNRRARRSLLLALSGMPFGNDTQRRTGTLVWDRLVMMHSGQREQDKLRRGQLSRAEQWDKSDLSILEAYECSRDQATVLHRWVREGRAKEARQWLSGAIDKANGGGVAARVLLSLLADKDADTRGESVRFCLKHLATGTSVYGTIDEVVEAADRMLWRFITEGAGLPENVVGLSTDRRQLQESLRLVVRPAKQS